MNYQQRSAARRAADAERRKQQTQNASARDPIYDLPADARRRIRQAELNGRREGEQRARIEEQAEFQAAIDATPEHLRRPENIYDRLIAEHEKSMYRPDVANRVKRFKRLSAEREKEIQTEMELKLRRHEVESNPETKPALDHWEKASASAESEEELAEWARLKGLIEGGGANDYWNQVAPIMEARLAKMQENWGKQVDVQATVIGETRRMAEQLVEIEELTNKVPSSVATETEASPSDSQV